jgi:hypothetical protein
MEGKVSRLNYLARAISRVTNPCILSVLVLLLIAGTESTDARALVAWVMTVLLLLVLVPLVYVYIRTFKNISSKKLIAAPTAFLKQHPRDILILGLSLGLPCLVILLFLEAPSLMLRTLVALLAGSIVAALLNIFYRVSYHLSAVTVLVIMSVLTWGQIFLVLWAAIPLIGWAKYYNHEHTPTQLALGIALAVVVSGATLCLFD